jgi:putative addiction module killer protein
MNTINATEEFDTWLTNLADLKGRAKILVRIDRAAAGNFGDA